MLFKHYNDHMLKLAMSDAWLWKMKHPENTKKVDCKLFNEKTGEFENVYGRIN